MEKLEKETWEICLGIVKHQDQQLLVLKNFGVLSFWLVESFSTKGIGQSYNELVGKDVTAYMKNQAFYAANGKSFIEQAQGISSVNMKFGHDDYILILNVV